MLRKKEVFTTITPIPGFIPRQLAINILHSHSEVITLNPLVTDHRAIPAPRDAAADEYYSTWYEITERMQFIPGVGKMGSGKIKFNGCFHDMPWGLQTHTYAPMNIDMRIKYRIDGNQPGVEPPAQAELGLSELGIPVDGLYLREDIEIRCNVTIVKYVKEQLKSASKDMVSRIIKKAELLDAGVLQGMIEDGKIKTINPNDRSYTGGLNAASAAAGTRSPSFAPSGYASPSLEQQQQHQHPGPGPKSPSIPYQVPRPTNYMGQNQGLRPGTAGSQGTANYYQQQQQQQQQWGHPPPPQVIELPQSKDTSSMAQASSSQPQQTFVAELPGNFYHPQPSPGFQGSQPSGGGSSGDGGGQSQPSPTFPHDRDSTASQQSRLSPDPNSSWRWSHNTAGGSNSNNGQPSPSQHSSRPTSISSEASSSGAAGTGVGASGFASPGLDHKGFSNELPTHRETTEEHGHGHALQYHQHQHQHQQQHQYEQHQPSSPPPPQMQKVDPSQHRVQGPNAYPYPYNPADYARAR